MKKYIFFLAVIVFLSCKQQSHSKNIDREALSTSSSASASHAPQAEATEKESPKKKIIRSASTKFEVVDVTSAVDEINAIVQERNGYISDQNMSDVDGKQNANIVIRVPSDALDILLRELSALAIHIDYTKVNSKDISEEYVDISSRLKTKEEVHQRYIDILRTKAGTIEELLAAERRIGVLQEEIEAAEGKIRYYDDKVSLSNVNVQIYKKEVLVAKVESRFVPFWSSAENQFIGGWNMLIRILIVLVGLWPLLLIGGVTYRYRSKLKVAFKVGR